MEFMGDESRRRMYMLPSGATLFSAYASLSATFTLIRQAFYQFVPSPVQHYLFNLFQQWFSRKSPLLNNNNLFEIIIEESFGYSPNKVFDACQIYISHKFSDSSNVLKVTRAPNEETMSFKLAQGVNYSETFEGILINWKFRCVASSSSQDDFDHDDYPPAQHCKKQLGTMGSNNNVKSSYFSLIFDKEHKRKVCSSYLPYVVQSSKDFVREEKLLKLIDCNARYLGSNSKQSVNMAHPFTFRNLAMDPDAKKAIKDDLDRFLRRKEFYRRVGKPWKRGYLLYGPPGTGKSSLIAAMANYLKFDIYDLQLGHVNDSSLRQLLISIPSQSIIVVEDIDCNRGLPRRLQYSSRPSPYEGYDNSQDTKSEPQMSLAALLSFADGLWSCCGDERLIVFTTNHKEKLDPALLRPGRMDMHIHMSYLTMEGFKVLAENYLQVSTNHELFGEIESLLGAVNATPAEVAEELIRSEDADIALQGVAALLKSKKKSDAEGALTFKLHQAEDTGQDTASGEVEKGSYADAQSKVEVPQQETNASTKKRQ